MRLETQIKRDGLISVASSLVNTSHPGLDLERGKEGHRSLLKGRRGERHVDKGELRREERVVTMNLASTREEGLYAVGRVGIIIRDDSVFRDTRASTAGRHTLTLTCEIESAFA